MTRPQKAEARRIFASHWARFRDARAAAVEAGVSGRTGRRWQAELRQEADVRYRYRARPSQRLIGREADLRGLRDYFDRGERLVTVFGAPGIGKTRVAVEFYERSRASGEDAYYCELQAANDLPEAYTHLARSFDARLVEGQRSESEARTVLARILAGKARPLVVLDNVEQIAGPLATSLATWLDASDVRFVVTSRCALRLGSERIHELNALSLPAPGADCDSDAMALFRERAVLVEPRFEWTEQTREYVADIVTLLEGLPLAIELAASQMGRSGARELLEQLRKNGPDLESPFCDRHPHHRSLTAAIEQSWRLLSARDQRVLSQLTVFRGPFTTAACEAVVAADSGRLPLRDSLGTLRQMGLLRVHDEPDATGARRWALFVAVQHFASRQLATATAQELRARHADFWLSWGGTWTERLRTERGAESQALLSSHLNELQAAFECFRDAGRVPDMVRTALVIYAAVRRWLPSVAVEPLTLAIESATHSLDPSSGPVTDLYIARGSIYRDLDEAEASTRDFEQVRRLTVEGSASRAELEYEEAVACLSRGACSTARRLLESALGVATESGDRHLEARVRSFLGRVLAEAFLDPAAFNHQTEAISLFRQIGDIGSGASAELLERIHRLLLSEPVTADELANCIPELRTCGDRIHEAIGWTAVGLAHLEAENPDQAEASFRRALSVCARTGLQRTAALAHLRLAMCHQQSGRSVEARLEYDSASQSLRHVGDARLVMLCGLYAAGFAASNGNLTRAGALLASAENAMSETEATGFEGLIALQEAQLILARAQRSEPARSDAALANASREVNQRISAVQTPKGSNRTTTSLPLAKSSPEARWMVRMLRRALDAPGRLSVWSDGSRFQCRPGVTVDVPQGPVLRKLLLALTEQRLHDPGVALDGSAILARCWPGQKVLPDAGRRRVHESIRRLRRLGLERALVTTDQGYAIDPQLSVAMVRQDAGRSGGA